jgi:hypothetical protein
MSLSIAGIGAANPFYAPTGPIASYAQDQQAAASVAATTAGTEAGSASVVYEAGNADNSQQFTYAHPEAAARAAAMAAAAKGQGASFGGDDAIVAATGGTVLPPPQLPDTPLSAEVREQTHNVWAPVHPILADPAVGVSSGNGAPVKVGQAEVAAQASYAAVVDAMIAGASFSDVGKFA